jgi:hypothetical protein
MNHFATPDFWHCYRHLPKEVRDLADKNFVLLRQDPHHPSLRLKKVGQDPGRRASACIIVLSLASEQRVQYGFGSATTANTIR